MGGACLCWPACLSGRPICVRSGSPRAIAFGHIVDVPAAAGAFGTGTAWVQLIIVASIVATLRINGDFQIIQHVKGELGYRSEERSGGKECVRTWRSGWAP